MTASGLNINLACLPHQATFPNTGNGIRGGGGSEPAHMGQKVSSSPSALIVIWLQSLPEGGPTSLPRVCAIMCLWNSQLEYKVSRCNFRRPAYKGGMLFPFRVAIICPQQTPCFEGKVLLI